MCADSLAASIRTLHLCQTAGWLTDEEKSSKVENERKGAGRRGGSGGRGGGGVKEEQNGRRAKWMRGFEKVV